MEKSEFKIKMTNEMYARFEKFMKTYNFLDTERDEAIEVVMFFCIISSEAFKVDENIELKDTDEEAIDYTFMIDETLYNEIHKIENMDVILKKSLIYLNCKNATHKVG